MQPLWGEAMIRARLAAWLLGDPELHPAVCRCSWHEGRARGYEIGAWDGFRRAQQEAAAYEAIRSAPADMERLVALRDGYRGARS